MEEEVDSPVFLSHTFFFSAWRILTLTVTLTLILTARPQHTFMVLTHSNSQGIWVYTVVLTLCN